MGIPVITFAKNRTVGKQFLYNVNCNVLQIVHGRRGEFEVRVDLLSHRLDSFGKVGLVLHG